MPEAKTFVPSRPLQPYSKLRGIEVDGDACKLSPALIRAMPMNHAAIYKVLVNTISHQVMVEKLSHPNQYIEKAIRIGTLDLDFEMVGYYYTPEFLEKVFSESPFPQYIKDMSKVLMINIQAKKEGEHHPAIRAKHFIPWIIDVIGQENVNNIIADFEPGSDTGKKYWQDIVKGMNRIGAMENSWAHKQYAKVGFSLIPKLYFYQNPNVYAGQPTVFALYERKK